MPCHCERGHPGDSSRSHSGETCLAVGTQSGRLKTSRRRPTSQLVAVNLFARMRKTFYNICVHHFVAGIYPKIDTGTWLTDKTRCEGVKTGNWTRIQRIARIKFWNRPQKRPNQGGSFEKGVLFFSCFCLSLGSLSAYQHHPIKKSRKSASSVSSVSKKICQSVSQDFKKKILPQMGSIS